MPYCFNCGSKLPDDAAFCPKCGTKVSAVSSGGAAATVPSDELREALTRMRVELEKAFNVAAKEVQQAFEAARNDIQRTFYKAPLTCPNCGEKNPASAIFCSKCGGKLSESTAEHKEDKQPI